MNGTAAIFDAFLLYFRWERGNMFYSLERGNV